PRRSFQKCPVMYLPGLISSLKIQSRTFPRLNKLTKDLSHHKGYLYNDGPERVYIVLNPFQNVPSNPSPPIYRIRFVKIIQYSANSSLKGLLLSYTYVSA